VLRVSQKNYQGEINIFSRAIFFFG